MPMFEVTYCNLKTKAWYILPFILPVLLNGGLITLSLKIIYKLEPQAHFFPIIFGISFTILGYILSHGDK